MKKSVKKRTEITIETHQLTIIRIREGRNDLVFCKGCGLNVRSFTHDQAALIFRVKEEILDALMRANQVHTINGEAVCGASLADYFKQEIRFIED